MRMNYLGKFRTYFITGLAVILPTFITIIILKLFITKINSWFLDPFSRFITPYTDSLLVIIILKFTVFVAIVIAVILCGFAARIIFVRKFFSWSEHLFTKTPLIGKIYAAIKEISAALFGKKKGLFKKVVIVEFPSRGLYSIGFVTCEHIDRGIISAPLDDDVASVFVPTSPTPASGYFVFVKKKDLIDVKMSVEEAIKLVISGGALVPRNEP
ncbi:MAG: DUF502 domain-containing protein [Candidatus Omnitrophica bacterium]|nr:DUF502 domain-containing protein [Candidatus Omnitrophota bacterium]